MSFDFRPVCDHKTILGEGPVWDNRRNKLFYIDSIGNEVYLYDPETQTQKTWPVGQNIGTLILTEKDNEVVVGLVDGLYILNLDSGELTKKVDPEFDVEGNRMNDGKADPAGRIWIASMCVADNGVQGYDTSFKCGLYRVGTDWKSTTISKEVRLGNGMAWTQDNKTFYFIDSPTRHVFQYDYDLETGTVENRRPCITIPESFGICDGMDIDVDGNLWIAHWTGWCIGKWDPRTGELLEKIDFPICRVASCCFGGENYDKLYVATASINTDKDDREQPDAGKLFVIDNPGTKGLPFNRFKG